MKVIKRNGTEVDFDQNKIIGAIRKANVSVEEFERASKGDAEAIASCIEDTIESCGHAVGVEEIQDMVQEQLMKHQLFKLAISYTTYRYHVLTHNSRNVS